MSSEVNVYTVDDNLMRINTLVQRYYNLVQYISTYTVLPFTNLIYIPLKHHGNVLYILLLLLLMSMDEFDGCTNPQKDRNLFCRMV